MAVLLVLASEDSKLGGQGAIEAPHQSVALWMKWCYSNLAHPQPPIDLTKDPGLKVPPLVTVELDRDPKAGEPPLHQLFSRLMAL